MRKKIFPLFAITILCLASTVSNCQDDERIVSPVVHPDRTVTFSFYAPDAEEVFVYTQFTEDEQIMKKDERGVWSVTLGPAEPEIYVYGFVVDDVEMADPWNRYVLVNEWPTRSIVEIPGDEPMYYDQRPVPHGRIQMNWYESKTLGTNRKFYVYTPPGYENNEKSYPVVYLLHGGGGYEFIWTEIVPAGSWLFSGEHVVVEIMLHATSGTATAFGI